jgi:hypothetical protein
MRKSYVRTAFGLAQAVVFALVVGTPLSADTSGYKVVDGLTVYYGVIPAKALREYPKGSPEAKAHARIPGGKHVHHLVVAVFEGDHMERITDAQVTARVRETGLGWTKKRLEPTTLNDALTFCNYFTFYDRTNYTIEIDVRRLGAPATVATKFEYRRH